MNNIKKMKLIYILLGIVVITHILLSLNILNNLSVTSETSTDTDTPKGVQVVFKCPQQPCHLSIVFMGDSLTRFMYYSLAYYLRHNKWIDPTSYPNLVKPRDFLNGEEMKFHWAPWYKNSTLQLHPYETCDCHREPGNVNRGVGKETVCENRYYHDPHRNNTVVYLQAFDPSMGIRGHFENPNEALMAYRNVDDQNQDNTLKVNEIIDTIVPYSWSYDWPDAITNMIAMKLKPNIFVMNAGLWHKNGWELEDQSYLDRLDKAIQDANIPRKIWKTTTVADGGKINSAHDALDQRMCQKESWFECFNITRWTAKIPSEFYIDTVHFVEPVYRKMNELLLFDHLGLMINEDGGASGGSDNNDNKRMNSTNLLEWSALGIHYD